MSDPIRDLQERLRTAEWWIRFATDGEDCVCHLTANPPCWVCKVREFLDPPALASPTKEQP